MTTNAGALGAMPWSREVLFIGNREDGAEPQILPDMKEGHEDVLCKA